MVFAQKVGATKEPFIFDIDTRNVNGGSDATSFNLPLVSAETYNCLVDWGDGSSDTITAYNQAETLHTYSTQGIKRITISGTCPLVYFFGTHVGEKLKIISIVQFGDCDFTDTWTNSFQNTANLVSILQDYPADFVVNANYMFASSGISSIAEGFDFPNLQEGLSMFNSTSNLTSLPNSFTLDSVVNAGNMFWGSPLTALPPNMVLANATSITSIIRSTQVQSLPLSLDLNKVTNGNRAFLSASAITNIPSGVSFSALTDGTNIFYSQTINTQDYTDLLIRMEATNPNSNVPFSARLSKYFASAATARANLVARGWTISDAGQI